MIKRFNCIFIIIVYFVVFMPQPASSKTIGGSKKDSATKTQKTQPQVTEQKKTQEKNQVAETKPPEPPPKPPDEALIEKKMAELNNTAWQIDITGLKDSKKGKPKKDIIRFIENRAISSRLAAEGYPEPRYSLKIDPDGIAMWRTVQTKDGVATVFWVGEIRGNTMQGFFTKYPAGSNQGEQFSFSGVFVEHPNDIVLEKEKPTKETQEKKKPKLF